MPRRRSAEPAADEILVCHTSHTFGPGMFFREGSRVRRSQISPFSSVYWTRDGNPDADVQKAQEALRGTPDTSHENTSPRIVTKQRFICVQTCSITQQSDQGSAMLLCEKGMEVLSGHPLLAEFPERFQPLDETVDIHIGQTSADMSPLTMAG